MITIFIHRWFLDQLQLYSDSNVRLIKLLVVGAGDLYKTEILPEFALLMIKAAEALMSPSRIRSYIGFDYTLMSDELQERINYDYRMIGRHRQKPSQNSLDQINRLDYRIPNH